MSRALTLDDVRALALALPGVTEGTSYGTPSFRVGRSMLARQHPDGESLVLAIDLDAREILTQSQPQSFYLTPHYEGYKLVLVRLARVEAELLGQLLQEAWRRAAPRKLVAALDGEEPAPRGKKRPVSR